MRLSEVNVNIAICAGEPLQDTQTVGDKNLLAEMLSIALIKDEDTAVVLQMALIYKRCSEGQIDEEERDYLLEKAQGENGELNFDEC